MRKRFEQQYTIGVKKIEDTEINLKCRDSFGKLILSIKNIYTTSEYNKQIFKILDDVIIKPKQDTGRPGMNLWQIFVFAQTRLGLNISYDRLHHMANNDKLLRQMLGIESEWGYEEKKFEYQNIIDNVTLLDDATLVKINDIIVQMGHGVFKKKEEEALRLKTDSFVVKSIVHYPTDYNLLWDSVKSILNDVKKLLKKYNIEGWRKLQSWHRELKNLMREVSLSSKKSEENKKIIVEKYLNKAKLFSKKIHKAKLPLKDDCDLKTHLELDYYISMLDKHIDLLERRIIKGEKIPHKEKVFSIYEPYTEWITKGKQNPSFELGKNLLISTDQYHLIVDFKIMEHLSDSQVVLSLADRLLLKYLIESWSFDKGFYSKENKELIEMYINGLVMPKKGKLNKIEYEEEHTHDFKKIRHKHSAVESNINELEHRGLDQCPDRGFAHFKNYIALGVCAYNLHRIGAELRRQEIEKRKKKKILQTA